MYTKIKPDILEKCKYVVKNYVQKSEKIQIIFRSREKTNYIQKSGKNRIMFISQGKVELYSKVGEKSNYIQKSGKSRIMFKSWGKVKLCSSTLLPIVLSTDATVVVSCPPMSLNHYSVMFNVQCLCVSSCSARSRGSELHLTCSSWGCCSSRSRK